jgi:hypothetical protein
VLPEEQPLELVMNRIAFASVVAGSLMAAAPASAVTNQDGEVLITQAAVNAGNITPGDTPGFPVTISVSGTYRLASNLVVTTQANGIEVRANEVTIEMGGRTLAGSGIGRNGIASFNRNLKIRNGTVRGFTNDGVRSIAQFLTVIDLVVTANGRNGIFADPGLNPVSTVAFASVTSSKITANGGVGISCADDCKVENSIISGNAFSGITFYGSGDMALGNVITRNGSNGVIFYNYGGAGNNTFVGNNPQISGGYIPLQPNACYPACPPPSPPCSSVSAC